MNSDRKSKRPQRADTSRPTAERDAPAGLSGDEFRRVGHALVEQIGAFLDSLHRRPVSPAVTLEEIAHRLGDKPLPDTGTSAEALFERVAPLLFDHSVLTAHSRFWAYVHGAGSPLAALGDFLAAALNSPVTSARTGPISSLIEAQTIRWLGELIGVGTDCGGIFVSGGSMANVNALAAALHTRVDWDVREEGVSNPQGQALRVYATAAAHTSIITALDLIGLGTRALHSIATDAYERMDPDALAAAIEADHRDGLKPLAVIATAGTTTLGAVDPIARIASICAEHNLWLHIDGAYGAMAALDPDAPSDVHNFHLADSIAIDPHKWMYMPLEVGCLLTAPKHHRVLYDTFCYSSSYYSSSPDDPNQGPALLPFRDQSPQTSRGFRALKVWLALQHVGRDGYARMIQDDIRLARRLYDHALAHPALEACSHHLSVTTLRYVPPDLTATAHDQRAYLDRLNLEILNRLQQSGVAYPSQTLFQGRYVLRVCIVNYRTEDADIDAFPDLIASIGADLDQTLRPLS